MIYAIDLGNGFSKRTFGSETFIDPTVYAFPNTFFGDGDKLAISINNQQAFLLGSDAVNSGQPLQYVLGDSNIKSGTMSRNWTKKIKNSYSYR